ncbi:hypothetical protein GC194_03100 [bacterium]|nr:hypothetical protein [bacterium]
MSGQRLSIAFCKALDLQKWKLSFGIGFSYISLQSRLANRDINLVANPGIHLENSHFKIGYSQAIYFRQDFHNDFIPFRPNAFFLAAFHHPLSSSISAEYSGVYKSINVYELLDINMCFIAQGHYMAGLGIRWLTFSQVKVMGGYQAQNFSIKAAWLPPIDRPFGIIYRIFELSFALTLQSSHEGLRWVI